MPKQPTNSLNQTRTRLGFSLPEVIVAIAVLGVLAILVTRFFIDSIQIGPYIGDQIDSVDEARDSLQIMSWVVREASDGDNGNYMVSGAGNNSLGLYANVDADADRELILFELDGEELKMITTQPSGNPVQYLSSNSTEAVLSKNVVNGTITGDPIFQYYNTDYPADLINNPLSSPVSVVDISLIKIQLDVKINPNSGPSETRVETFIRLRNKD